MSYIKVEDLSLGYDSEIVCSNINFEINRSEEHTSELQSP